jgi:nicotinamidase-related amidase/RimJ/RimL family protein N-acetyltransferase
MISLRELRDADIAQIRQWPSYPGDMEQMDYALRDQGWLEEFRTKTDVTLYAAVAGDELIGFSILAKTAPAEAEFRIALRADRTGQRLGETVSSLTLQKGFGELGLARIHLIVRKNNRRGIRLYQRLGFTACGECQKEIQRALVDFITMEVDGEKLALGSLNEKERIMANGKRRALIVIDVQNDYVGGNLPIEYPPVEQSLANIGRAMDAAKSAAIPVVVVQNILLEGAPFMAKGTHGAELHPVVASRGWEHFIQKNLPSALAGTGLEEWLRARQIDTLTIVGYMTHNCDLSTVVQAMQLGFSVELLSDATGSLPYANRAGSATAEETHRVMLVVMQARFAAVLTTDEWHSAVVTGATPERDSIYDSNRRVRHLP